MSISFLPDESWNNFIESLMKLYPVIAPVAVENKFSFLTIKSTDEIRLDYDITILSPKKVFFPPRQDLFKFENNTYETLLKTETKILLGVHPHDIKAISMTDKLFARNYKDNNYLDQRNKTYIIGSNVQTFYKHAFFGSVSQEVKVEGHDIFLTKLNDGFLFEVLTEKGRTLAKHAKLIDASENQKIEAKEIDQTALDNCPETLEYTSDEIKSKMDSEYDNNEKWDMLSYDCFSCGSCNIVCPTCNCYDVQDEWNEDGIGGVRYRKWDGCLTCEFAEVSVQGGTENFRAKTADRFKHRMMKKTSYLNEFFEGPACVGCGRCTGACTADIANPVKIIKSIMNK